MNWWKINKRDADLERELRSDLEQEEEEQREAGRSPEEARNAALRSFGNPTLIREQTRAIWSWNWREETTIGPRWQLPGRWFATCSLWIAEIRTSCPRRNSPGGQRLKGFS
jgi:hypothetical protein